MQCQEYYCLLLGMTSCDHDAKSSVCQVITPQLPWAAVAPQCQSLAVAAGPAGSAPWPANTLASLAECRQDTNDKVKAYLTDIIWIITRSLVLRQLEIRTAHRDQPAVHTGTRAWPLQQQKAAAELQQERASRQSSKSTDRPSWSRTKRLDPSVGLERGRCAQPPHCDRYDISYPVSIKYLTSKGKLRSPYFPILNRYSVRHQSFYLRYPLSRYCNTILYSISNKNFDIVQISSVQRPSKLNIVPIYRRFSFDIEVKTFDIECGKDPGIGASSISYPISTTK
jgi:hypothetical protein